MTFSTQFLDEIRARTSLSALVGRTVAMKKAGGEHKGCCPFHNEKSPSFYVNDAKGFYHCFGCGSHGDAIKWMTDQQGLPFVDAVKELATAAGMEIPASDPRQAERDREMTEMREIMRQACNAFYDLRGGIREYAASRGIGEDVVDEFQLGHAPGRMNLLRDFFADLPRAKITQLGLIREKDNGDAFDFFRNRLMIPIHDSRGRVVGFGGRILGEGEPKYLNSPDTPLFDKGRTLFNLHRAAPAARKAGRVIIVEGYMDVIALYRAGVTETVAPNGTALTEAQMQLAWRMADTPILCMDGDKAGMAAMARAAIRALPLLEAGKSLSFVTPPNGMDPDDILREGGPEAVQTLFVKPRPLVDVLWAYERNAAPCDTPEQVAGLKARMRAHVKSIRNADVREAYGQELAKRFRETFDAIAQGTASGPQIRSRPAERTPFSRKAQPQPASDAKRQIGREGMSRSIEHAIMLGLARHPDVAVANMEAISEMRLRFPEFQQMRDALVGALIKRIGRDDVEKFLFDAGLKLADRALQFTFLRPSADPYTAAQDLERAIRSMHR